MRKLVLNNFRCFKSIEFSFRPNINLLVGDNASGKTSVLKSCLYVLSSFFSGFKDDNTKYNFFTFSNNDFREIVEDEQLLQEEAIDISSDISDAFNDGFNGDIQLIRASKEHRLIKSKLTSYRKFSANLLNMYSKETIGRQEPLPLFVSYSTNDIHYTRKINEKKFLSYLQKPSFGYYECFAASGFLKHWNKRMLVLAEAEKSLDEIEIVKAALISSLGEGACNILKDIEVRTNKRKVFYRLLDGREITEEQLSDGYKRIVSIITDIAFRCALLNKNYYNKLDVCSKTKGTVLIDEIDLHLHPTLQSTILKGLQSTFPSLQFIVSTHAPMVMSSIANNDANIVYKLDYSKEEGYTAKEVITYGMDLSNISEVILNQVPRNADTDAELEKLFDLIDDGELEKANDYLGQLESKYKTLPELEKAKVMINLQAEFLENEEDSQK